jgi:hypothetical protein
MPIANDLPEVLETTEPECLATGFIFTEGPLWHPDGYWYFVDLRRNQLLRLTAGKEPELVRTTIGGNGTTFDLQGRLIVCEGDDRRLTRMGPDGKVESLVDKVGASTGRTMWSVTRTGVSISPIRTSAVPTTSARYRAPRGRTTCGTVPASIAWRLTAV